MADGQLVLNPYDPNEQGQRFCLKEECISNVHDHRVLDIVEGNTEQGAAICLWEEHGGDNQKWDFDYLYVSYLQCCSFKLADVKQHIVAENGGFYASSLITSTNIADCIGRYIWFLDTSGYQYQQYQSNK